MTQRYDAVLGFVDLTPDEETAHAALPVPAVPPRTIEGRLLIKALTDDQAAQLKPRDLLRITGDQRIVPTNGAVTRVAQKLGLAVSVWFDAAAAGA